MPGVAIASAQIGMLLDKEMSGVSMGVPEMIMGSDLRGDELETFKVTLLGRPRDTATPTAARSCSARTS